MKIKIEKNIPLPEKGDINAKWHFIEEMQSGDSFVMPSRKLANNAYGAAKMRGIQLMSRKQADGTIRMWRV